MPATAEQLQGLSIKELKALADKRKVDLTGCAEKGDLVHALVAARVLLPPSAASAPPPAPAPAPPAPSRTTTRRCRRRRPTRPTTRRRPSASARGNGAASAPRPPRPSASAPPRPRPPPPPPPAVVTIDDDEPMAPGDDDDGVAPAPAAPTHDSEIAAWAALAPRGVREAWEKAGLDFGQQLREAFSGSSDATELDAPAALKQAAELETVAIGLRFFAAVGARPPRADDVRITDKVRQAYPLVDVRHAQAKSGELSLMDALKELAPARLRLAGLMRVLDAARERGDVRARLRGLGARNCLRGEEVVVTGVCELLGGREDNRGDTRRELIECIEQLGGTCKSDVTGTDAKQGTTLLVVGLGEKGEGGKRNARARRQRPRKSSLRRRRSTRSARRNGTPRSRSAGRSEEAMRQNPALKKPHVPKSCRPTSASCARTSSTRGWRRCRRSATRTRRRTPGRRRRPRRASSRICGASTTRTRRRRRTPWASPAKRAASSPTRWRRRVGSRWRTRSWPRRAPRRRVRARHAPEMFVRRRRRRQP